MSTIFSSQAIRPATTWDAVLIIICLASSAAGSTFLSAFALGMEMPAYLLALNPDQRALAIIGIAVLVPLLSVAAGWLAKR